MTVSIIAAVAENGVIGAGNGLVWHLPEDLKSFKRLTMGHYIIMGRNTHESIGRPLPGRTNIVISRNRNYKVTGCLVFNSLNNALDHARSNREKEVFIIGGAQLYHEAISKADKMYFTRVHGKVDGDVYFPGISLKDWEILKRTHFKKDDRHAYSFDILELKKKI